IRFGAVAPITVTALNLATPIQSFASRLAPLNLLVILILIVILLSRMRLRLGLRLGRVPGSWAGSQRGSTVGRAGRSAREDLSDDILDGDFLDVNVAYRQFIQESFADRDHTVPFDPKPDHFRRLLDDFTEPRQGVRWQARANFALDSDQFKVGKA